MVQRCLYDDARADVIARDKQIATLEQDNLTLTQQVKNLLSKLERAEYAGLMSKLGAASLKRAELEREIRDFERQSEQEQKE